MNSVPLWAWVAFHLVILAVVVLDLGVLNRAAKAPSALNSLKWTGVWVALSLGFCAILHRQMGAAESSEWLSAYVLEYALSVDNIFVFVVVFRFFAVPSEHQRTALLWGIGGAFALRAAMLLAGAAALGRFAWVALPFGAFLGYTAWKLAFSDEEEVEPARNPALQALRRFVPVSQSYDGGKFWTAENGRRAATPLLAVLLVLETTDLLFALDSIPATLAVVKSRDMFVAYTANICAILGLRSLFFALSGVRGRFHLLKYGLSLVLVFVGAQMLLGFTIGFEVPTWASLAVIASILAGTVLLSVLWPEKPKDVS